jgi:hypothetical protein
MTQTSDGHKPLGREDTVPALIRPGMYTGEQGDRTHEQWLADAVCAYVNYKRGLKVNVPSPDQGTLGL